MPLVIGCLYNGEQKSEYGTADNRFKTLQTVDGERLVFEGKKNIILQDEKGNKLHIDIENDTITIHSLKDIVLNAVSDININAGKDINVNVGMNMHTTVGQNATTNVGMQYSLFAGDIFESADRSIQSQAEEIEENTKERSATSEGETNFHSQQSFKNNGGEKSNLF